MTPSGLKIIPRHTAVKLMKTIKKKALKASSQERQVTFRGKMIRISTDFSPYKKPTR